MNSFILLDKSIFKLWEYISPHRRKQFTYLLFLMVIVGFAEIVSIGAIIPFLALLVSPEKINKFQFFDLFFDQLSYDQILGILTLFFIITSLLVGLLRIVLLRVSIHLSYMTGTDLGAEVYKTVIYQPYIFHINRNSSSVIDVVNKAHGVITSIIFPTITLISGLITLFFVVSGLIYINASLALSVLLIFAITYLTISRLIKNRMNKYSMIISKNSEHTLKLLIEGLGGIRDILLNHNQNFYYDTYRKADKNLRASQSSSQFLTQCPRYIVETFGMSLIVVIAYLLMKTYHDNSLVIPTIGALALGAQRILPVLQQLFSAIVTIRSGRNCLYDVLEVLENPIPDLKLNYEYSKMPFTKEISLNRISFKYSKQTPMVLNDVSLKINKGDRIGFIGESGSGKSTTLDVIMGLLSPTTGKLEIDGKEISKNNLSNWQANIAHVPQSIYLIDASILENIAFGVHNADIDFERVKYSAKCAKISELIDSLPEGYETIIGENGIKLSGGQRQRIGIARALYKQADIIIFDEATSALDTKTENLLIQFMESLNLKTTILVVAHRLSTLKFCNRVVKISNGQISEVVKIEQSRK